MKVKVQNVGHHPVLYKDKEILPKAIEEIEVAEGFTGMGHLVLVEGIEEEKKTKKKKPETVKVEDKVEL